jgi:hypothetical protein
MADKSGTHPHVAFAQRHSKSILSTLNAFATLSRVGDLLDDLKELDAAVHAYEAAGNSKGRRFSWFEITSYYPVAFATCLEWHARSRLVDLFTFRPTAIRAEDLKGQVSDKLLAQMAAEGITIAQLIGAMTHVGSSSKYIGIFDRLFRELAIDENVRGLLNPIVLSKESGEQRDELEWLFEYRHGIVHEIDFSTIGPWLVRDTLDIEEAYRLGLVVRDVISYIERKLSVALPRGFPNRLDSELLAEDESEHLGQEIVTLEDEITDAIRTYSSEADKGSCADDWLNALAASRASQQTELDFLSRADFIPTRHFDFRKSLQVAHLRLRLEYLKRLRTEV